LVKPPVPLKGEPRSSTKISKMELQISEIVEFLYGREINERHREVMNIFLLAINDWPTEVLTLEGYEREVSAFIKGETRKANIETVLKTIDLSKNAWESESLVQIIRVFDSYEEASTLKKIIEILSEKIQKTRK